MRRTTRPASRFWALVAPRGAGRLEREILGPEPYQHTLAGLGGPGDGHPSRADLDHDQAVAVREHAPGQEILDADEAGHGLADGTPEDALGWADLGEPPLEQHRHPIPEPERLGAVVRDQHGRRAGRGEEPAQIVEQRLARGRIERGERLVEEEHVRRGREGSREAHALGLAARQPVHGPVRQRGDAETVEPVPGPPVGLRARHAAQPTREARVVEDGAPAERATPGRRTPCAARQASRSASVAGTAPWSRTVPRVGRARSASARRSVDFPAPFGPITASTSPGVTAERRHVERRWPSYSDLEVQGFQDRRGRARPFPSARQPRRPCWSAR